jgi:O-antigen/teichoic acid export membrane protein
MNTTSPSSATLPETTPETKNQSPPHPAPTALGTKMMRSVLVGGLRCVAIAPVPFIMTPLVLHRLGVAGYGTWAVFLAINGLTSLADLGLMGTVSKFVAEYHARQDFAALARLLNSGLALFGC